MGRIQTPTLDIASIIPIAPGNQPAYVPPLADYSAVSSLWSEAEFRCLDSAASRVVVGYWTGEPGSVSLDAWLYTEVCSILSGRVAVKDTNGARRDFGAGEGFIVPKGFVGEWINLEPSTKFFVAIY